MANKTVKVDKDVFDSVLRRMMQTPTTPRAALPKLKKKLARIIEPLKKNL